MNNEKFSVLVTVYHRDSSLYLNEALKSVFGGTISPVEVILVKDGLLTKDLDTVISEYENKYPTLKVISLLENRGLGFALNEGIKHCSYNWIGRMDADDICFPNRFEKQLEIIEKYPELSFISSSIAEFVDYQEEIVSYRNLPEFHEEIYNYAKTRCPLNHPAVIYRKQAVLDCGGYREFPEDYHLWVRALMKGYKFYNIQEPLLYFRSNINTIKRRGGWKYAVAEIGHQREFYKIGFLSYFQFLKNSISRFVVRIIPSKIRSYLYSELLRTKNK